MALTQVSSNGIKNATLLNEDLNANAAIAGSKINPEFGGQDITTTGASDVFLQLEKSGTRTWKAKYETNSTIASNGPTLKITSDKDVGGAGEPGLGLYIDEDMHLHLWDDSQTLPATMPHTNVRPTFSVYGDILVGDIIAIANNPMTYFMRVETGLDATKVTNFFCARNGANDTDGGPTITMAPDQTGSVNSGYISLSAYGQGSGQFANSIRFQNRSSANTVSDRAIINNDGNFGVGLTTGLTGRISAKHSSGTIGYFESTQAAANVSNIVGNSTDTNSSANLVLQVNSGNTANSIIRCNGNNDTVILNGATPAEKARFLAGGGLCFNGDTAAANALDDYEEGTWTPADYSSSSISITNSNTARYTKIGRFVYLTFDITYASNSSTQLSRVQSPFSAQNYGSGYVGWTTLGRPIQMHVSGTSVYFMDNNASNDYKHLYNNELSGIRLIGAFLLHV
jgi:hypothetical protein|tara:strand:+ start:1542 stop:2906 length:1365 start_codon:yes stop_codon:yes gene_type:complete